MATVDLKLDDFEKTIEEGGIVFVDFWADWCQPCKQFAPIYEQASEEHPDVVFAKVNTEKEEELAAMAQITAIPTLMAFRDGIAIFRQAGALPAAVLDDVIQQVKAVDMDEVKAEIEKLSK